MHNLKEHYENVAVNVNNDLGQQFKDHEIYDITDGI